MPPSGPPGATLQLREKEIKGYYEDVKYEYMRKMITDEGRRIRLARRTSMRGGCSISISRMRYLRTSSSTITSNDNASGSGGTTADTTGTPTTAVPASLTELANRQLQAARDEHASSGSTFKLQAPTMAVGRYRVGGQPVLKTSNQRNLPGTGPRATTDNLTVLPGINTTYGNMHGEMGGVHHSLESRLAKGGEPAVLEEIGASQEICFLCEMVLSMLGIAYDHAHISRIVYPKWDDPTGKFRDEGGFLPLSALLERLGISRAEARGRLVARLTRETGDEAQAGALADRILAGELQGGRERIELIRDLRKVPSLKAASAKSKSAATTSTGRKPQTKAARREKALLDKARRMEKKRAFEEEKKSPPIFSSPLSGGVLASSAASETEQDRPSKLPRRAQGADSPHLSALWSRLRQARQGITACPRTCATRTWRLPWRWYAAPRSPKTRPIRWRSRAGKRQCSSRCGRSSTRWAAEADPPARSARHPPPHRLANAAGRL